MQTVTTKRQTLLERNSVSEQRGSQTGFPYAKGLLRTF